MEAGAGCVYPRTMGYDGDTETVTGFRMSLRVDGKYLAKPFRLQSVLRNQFSVPTGRPYWPPYWPERCILLPCLSL